MNKHHCELSINYCHHHMVTNCLSLSLSYQKKQKLDSICKLYFSVIWCAISEEKLLFFHFTWDTSSFDMRNEKLFFWAYFSKIKSNINWYGRCDELKWCFSCLAASRAIIKNMFHVRAQFFSLKLFNYYEPKAQTQNEGK